MDGRVLRRGIAPHTAKVRHSFKDNSAGFLAVPLPRSRKIQKEMRFSLPELTWPS